VSDKHNGKFLVHCIVGARPNFVKIAPIMKALEYYDAVEPRLIHTGQHYDVKMSEAFFEDLEIPTPDRFLNVGSASHAVQTARIMESYEQAVLEDSPDLVLVVGDVNSTLACSIVAAKLLIPIIHVEAGLRSGDRTMPEEINRIVTDALADYLFTSCEDAQGHLLREGVAPEKIHFVGNVMIDTLLDSLPLAAPKMMTDKLDLPPNHYGIATIHRPSNVDDTTGFERVLEVFESVGEMLPIVFPIHPRTEKRAEALGLSERLKNCPNLKLVPPMHYLEFVDLLRTARLVLTDSGGIQEETTVLNIPCLTMRENTERPVTIEQGTNHLVGTDPKTVIAKAEEVLAAPIPSRPCKVPLWDGFAAERIGRLIDKIRLGETLQLGRYEGRPGK
jgi:UDP-N-acetylglucosamine 2-epimerase (non-hydrolysing)